MKHLLAPAFHFFETPLLFRTEKRNDLAVRLAHRLRDAIVGFAANVFQLLRGTVDDRPDLRCLLGRELQSALEVVPHSLAGRAGMAPQESEMLMARGQEKTTSAAGEENDQQGDGQLPFPILHGCHALASIALSAMA